MANHVLVTGVTGFVGKVVLEELLRRKEELEIGTVFALIRRKRGTSPVKRFRYEVVSSRCFTRLEDGWERSVEVVAGELAEARCGLSDQSFDALTDKITHIIHCAASVDFHLPIARAAAANITSALNVLALGRKCPKLRSLVDTSTAYVTPTDGTKAIRERLAPLPRPAEAIYRNIIDGTADQDALLAETGHPNTYTFTKCISEHLLMERRGEVPLTIVRPSIINAAWRYPFPGWIDSPAAFAGFALAIGAGHMRALNADPDKKIDIIPVDEVAERLIRLALLRPPPTSRDQPAIYHATAGIEHSCRIGDVISTMIHFFRRHPVYRTPDLHYFGTGGPAFRLAELRHHRAPALAVRALARITGQRKLARNARRLGEGLVKLNDSFPYFTSRVFDFRTSVPIEDPQFNAREFIELSCAGVYRHLMCKDDTEVSIGGRRHLAAGSEARWTLTQPRGNWAIRGGSYAVAKTLKRAADLVTFDQPSFERAVAAAPEGSLTVLIPSHRSYMDFVLVSYLAFARPNLGIAIPHIAATSDFAKIPVLGELFKQAYAFYIRRGIGREDPRLTQRIHELADRRQTLEFFIEGTRSRSRQFLRPKRGLLRALQSTGRTITILPISICYDRVPEESAFTVELGGRDKPEMKLRGLLGWTGRVSRGEVDLGRIHMSCGEAVILDPEADVKRVALEVMRELQAHTATSTFHLRAFLARNPIEGIDLPWLRRAIQRRGGRMIDSRLRGAETIDAMMEQCMRYHWLHLFYPEAMAAFPDHPAIRHHCLLNGFAATTSDVDVAAELGDPCVRALLRALFEPVCRDYVTAVTALGSPTARVGVTTPGEVVRKVATAHLPNVEACFEDLCERDILRPPLHEADGYDWGPRAADLSGYEAACRWPEDDAGEAPRWSTVVWA